MVNKIMVLPVEAALVVTAVAVAAVEPAEMSVARTTQVSAEPVEGLHVEPDLVAEIKVAMVIPEEMVKQVRMELMEQMEHQALLVRQDRMSRDSLCLVYRLEPELMAVVDAAAEAAEAADVRYVLYATMGLVVAVPEAVEAVKEVQEELVAEVAAVLLDFIYF